MNELTVVANLNAIDDANVDPALRSASSVTLTDSATPSTSSGSGSRRVTRSQTAPPIKRRRAAEIEDNAMPPPPKKGRVQQRRPSETSASSSGASASTSALPVSDSALARPPSPTSIQQFSLSDNSSSPTVPAPERRGARLRRNLPIPVPNLTKKSRGRHVPSAPAVEGSDGQIVEGNVNQAMVSEMSDPRTTGDKDKDPKSQPQRRTYTCTVEGCGKCFHRGEHLKRHIRSIHTHDKPFQCEYAGCNKFFNRHDNLLQHLKVHTHTRKTDRATKTTPDTNNAASASTPPPTDLLSNSTSTPTESPTPTETPTPTTSHLIAALKYSTHSQAQGYPKPDEGNIAPQTRIAVSSARTEMAGTSPRRQDGSVDYLDTMEGFLRDGHDRSIEGDYRHPQLQFRDVREDGPHGPVENGPRGLQQHRVGAGLEVSYDERMQLSLPSVQAMQLRLELEDQRVRHMHIQHQQQQRAHHHQQQHLLPSMHHHPNSHRLELGQHQHGLYAPNGYPTWDQIPHVFPPLDFSSDHVGSGLGADAG